MTLFGQFITEENVTVGVWWCGVVGCLGRGLSCFVWFFSCGICVGFFNLFFFFLSALSQSSAQVLSLR